MTEGLCKQYKKIKVLVTRCVSNVKFLMGMHEKHLQTAEQPEGRKSFLERLSALGFNPSSVQILNIMSRYLSTKDILPISAFCRPLLCKKPLNSCIYRTRQKASSTITHRCTVGPAGLQTALELDRQLSVRPYVKFYQHSFILIICYRYYWKFLLQKILVPKGLRPWGFGKTSVNNNGNYLTYLKYVFYCKFRCDTADH